MLVTDRLKVSRRRLAPGRHASPPTFSMGPERRDAMPPPIVARRAGRFAACLVGVQLLAPAPDVQAQASTSSGIRPPQAECPAVRDIDLRALARQRERDLATEARRAAQDGLPSPDVIARGMIDAVRVADWASRRPLHDAAVVIRTRMPGGGGHATDHRTVVGRDADGAWWIWRQVLGGPPAMPPLPPGPDVQRGSPEWIAWESAQPPADRSMDDRNYPPQEGRLSHRDAERLEAAWRDPCRGWDPDFWPAEIPLNRRIDGLRRRDCAQDRSAIFGEIREGGQPARIVGAACRNDSPTYRMIAIATYGTAETER